MPDEKQNMILNIDVQDNKCSFEAEALALADFELSELNNRIEESIESIQSLTPKCDKTDYVLAVSCGSLCALIDIFLVGKPGESKTQNAVDKWAVEKTKAFAKFNKWDDSKDNSLKSAISFLEQKYKIPYDQISSDEFSLSSYDHHFKSLPHNPSIMGLFFSILDQFLDKSHFVADGVFHELPGNNMFHLKGENVHEKLFFGFVNWFGHIISDFCGSHKAIGRGMGIPSPFWTWMNDIIVIKDRLGIPASEFDKKFNRLAIEIFKNGYDSRFQIVQAIPVLVNELVVRIVYSVRRLMLFFQTTPVGERDFKRLWKSCEPFSNSTVKRMLTVAHGSFCLIDIGDAIGRGIEHSGFNIIESIMRVNVIGIGRFSISLYGEVNRSIKKADVISSGAYLEREKQIVDDYIVGLKYLSKSYNESYLVCLADDIEKSDAYKLLLTKTVKVAETRGVPEKLILRNKADIDAYFMGE